MAEDMGDKSEMPTSRRMEEARSRGQIAKSQDLIGAVDLVAALVLLSTMGGGLVRAFRVVLEKSLEGASSRSTRGRWARCCGAGAHRDRRRCRARARRDGHRRCHRARGAAGTLWTLEPLMPKFDRLNPINGLKRLMGVRGAAKSGVNSLKLAVALFTAWSYLSGAAPRVSNLPMLQAATGRDLGDAGDARRAVDDAGAAAHAGDHRLHLPEVGTRATSR